MDRQAAVVAERAVDREEEAIQVVARRVPGRAGDAQLVQPGGLGDGPHRPVVHQEQQRDDRPARPGRKAVDAERSPRGQEHQLRGHDGQIVPAPLTEEGEPDAREGPGRGDAAAPADEVPRPGQLRRVRGVARELEREVTLDAGREIARRSVVHRPAAVRTLVVADVLRHAAPALLVAGAEEPGQEQVLGVHRGVRFQLRPPEPLRELLAGEPRLRAFDDEIQGRVPNRALAADHEAPRCPRRARSSNQRTAFASASRTGVCRKPSSRRAREQFANITSRAVRTPSRGMRGGRPRIRPSTKASAWARPSASKCGSRIRGALRPATSASSSSSSRIIKFAWPRMYRSPGWPRSKASRWPWATSSTSTTFMPVSTYAGIRPSRKSRISPPVGVGLTSPTPTGNVGFTITASSPPAASSRTSASASHLLFLYGPGGGPVGVESSSGRTPSRIPPIVAMLDV